MLLLLTAQAQVQLDLHDLSTLVGHAELNGDVLNVAPAFHRALGAAWSPGTPWQDHMLFRAHWHAAHWGGDNETGASGLVFVIQSESAVAIGEPAQFLGFDGISSSIGVEADLANSFGQTEISDNHLAIVRGGSLHALVAASPGFDLNGGEDGYHVWLEYSRMPTPALKVFVSQVDQQPMSALVETTLDIDVELGAEVWIGFTGAAGNAENFDINYQRVLAFDFVADLDSDGDGVMDFEDQCEGFDDHLMFPGAPLIVGDGIDNDCSQGGFGDECYADADGDGVPWRTIVDSVDSTCSAANNEYLDGGEDCDDADAERFPGNPEVCDDIDHDCIHGATNGFVLENFWPDLDDDGFGDEDAAPELACEAPMGSVSNDLDCDDGDDLIRPGGTELCNGIDDNCNTNVDEGLQTSAFYLDQDFDHWGSGAPVFACEAPPAHVELDGDCAPSDPGRHPGAHEVCDGIDNDCDLEADENLPVFTTWIDLDGDGFGEAGPGEESCIESPPQTAAVSGDCDDSSNAVYPDAPEVCDQRDNDCNAVIDDVPDPPVWFADFDADGLGDPNVSVAACDRPADHVENGDDCDDSDPLLGAECPAILEDFIDTGCGCRQVPGSWSLAPWFERR